MDLRPHLRAGTGVWWGQGAAEATPLVDALIDQVPGRGPVTAFCGLSFNQRLASADLPRELALTSYGAMGTLGQAHARGRLDVVPAHYSTLPRLFAEGLLPCDVGLVQVSPPGADGCCSMGVGADYAADAAAASPVLIGEINHRMPSLAGSPRLAMWRFAAVVESDRPLAEVPPRPPDAVDQVIAGHVAALVEDGDTIQVGVGALPDAVLAALGDHADLGYHAGLLSDGALALHDKGVLTGARKEVDAGTMVAGTAMGTADFYRRLAEVPVRLRPASYTHDPAVLCQLRSLVAINAALQVDLSGQVGAQLAGGRYVGGLGGQSDFAGAAARCGARSVIALRSTARRSSTILPVLPGASVTTSRADVDAIVTEHGVAHLRGCPESDRPRRIAAIAAPEHRESLLAAARGAGA